MSIGRIHSFQSLGTVDGPGIRAVVFMQGCPLRCSCCHNPDTWDFSGGTQISVQELFNKIIRCKKYFGTDGGVTASGGEPLMQAEFLAELFDMLKKEKIHTALDTSGYVLNSSVEKLLSKTDLVILDYKYTNEKDYEKYTKSEQNRVDDFLTYLNDKKIDTWIRQVIISGINDNEDSVKRLLDLKKKYNCIKKIELLPFKKLCIEKYRNLNIPFAFENIPETSKEQIEKLQIILNDI